MPTAIDRYRDLRCRVDQRMRELVACHGKNAVCKPGCCDCCVNLSVFPVEYYAILQELREGGCTGLPFDPGAPCGYLKDRRCVLYASRPLICRTHGLPVAFLNENEDGPERVVSFCPKNFVGVPDDELIFGPDHTLDLDEMNAELFLINMDFLEQSSPSVWQPTSRIRLSQLVRDLAGPGGS